MMRIDPANDPQFQPTLQTVRLSSDAMAAPSLSDEQRDYVAELAYQYWEERGCLHGEDLDDWLRAERVVLQRMLPPTIDEAIDVPRKPMGSDSMAAAPQVKRRVG